MLGRHLPRVRENMRRIAAFIVCCMAACSPAVTHGTSPLADGGPEAQDAGQGAGQDGGALLDGAALPALPMATGAGRFAIAGRAEDAIEGVVPEQRPASPPQLILL